MKTICVVIGSRANYASVKSVMHAIQAHPLLDLQVIVMGSASLARYGNVVQVIESDGFRINERLLMIVEGETPLAMAKSTGLGLIEISTALDRLAPKMVLTVGDRYETMATTLAASYMNIPLAHTMGGELSGTIDESVRHATTKFANLHFPATSQAADNIRRLGEDPKSIFLVGCPRMDLIKSSLVKLDPADLNYAINQTGVGFEIDCNSSFFVVCLHPVTTEYSSNRQVMINILEALDNFDLPSIVLWPNSDAGSDEISRAIRWWRENRDCSKLRFIKNLPPEFYLALLSVTCCLIGNSSSGIREGSFLGTPVVNIGTRQSYRERSSNTVDCSSSVEAISEAITHQMHHGRYEPSFTYGDGSSGQRIANVLAEHNVNSVQKSSCW